MLAIIERELTHIGKPVVYAVSDVDEWGFFFFCLSFLYRPPCRFCCWHHCLTSFPHFSQPFCVSARVRTCLSLLCILEEQTSVLTKVFMGYPLAFTTTRIATMPSGSTLCLLFFRFMHSRSLLLCLVSGCLWFFFACSFFCICVTSLASLLLIWKNNRAGEAVPTCRSRSAHSYGKKHSGLGIHFSVLLTLFVLLLLFLSFRALHFSHTFALGFEVVCCCLSSWRTFFCFVVLRFFVAIGFP